jgi:predicted transcriptional regulator
MDKDAKYLASAILMPTEIFTELATEYTTELDGEDQILRYKVVDKLSKKFEVSFETASIRFEQLKLDRLIS